MLSEVADAERVKLPAGITVSGSVATAGAGPPVAEMDRFTEPAGAVTIADTRNVACPPGAICVGEKLTVTPEGTPETDRFNDVEAAP